MIRKAQKDDAAAAAALAANMWDHSPEALAEDFRAVIADEENAAVFLAELLLRNLAS